MSPRPQNRANKTSKYRGVDWHAYHRKWRARIFRLDVPILIGYFRDEVTAARAYDFRARDIHGSAAQLNFPEDS